MMKAVIFDFFGVFCPDITRNWLEKAMPNFESILRDFQEICTRSDFGELNKKNFYKELSSLTNIPVPKIVAGVEAEISINIELVDYVKKLHSDGYRIACLSNGTHEWTLSVINRFDLANMFDAIVLSGDLGIVKPDSKIYYHALSELGVTTSEAIFVDDRRINTEAAEAIGIKSIIYSSFDQFKVDYEELVAF